MNKIERAIMLSVIGMLRNITSVLSNLLELEEGKWNK
tara:strand:- start:127 stop:237 length:111 start_codon:yes stop_codon:yes gene_type:complete